LALGLLLVATTVSVAAPKTDTVLLRNGDTVTGELKELKQGLLRYKTDSMATVYVEWVDVVRVVSNQRFQVEDIEGDFYFGELLPGAGDGRVRVGVGDYHNDLEMFRVVRINPIQEGYWATLDGSVSLGFQVTKSTGVVQWSLSSSASRRTRKFVSSVELRTNLSTAREEPTQQNANLSYGYDRFLGHRWAAGGSLALERNDALGIDFRTLLAGVVTRSVRQTTRQRMAVSAGAAYNNENVADSPNNESVEGVLGWQWQVFKYKSPKTDFLMRVALFPSLTNSGRVRSESDVTLRQELIKDFFWDLTGYLSYDSRPPNEEAATNDYGLTTSLGYTF
jgi:hypothetical protein